MAGTRILHRLNGVENGLLVANEVGSGVMPWVVQGLTRAARSAIDQTYCRNGNRHAKRPTSHKELYLSSWYWRLKQRTDSKRAIVALARKLLVIIYAMLKANQPYEEEKFLERKKKTEQRRINRMASELTRLGYAVSLSARSIFVARCEKSFIFGPFFVIRPLIAQNLGQDIRS